MISHLGNAAMQSLHVDAPAGRSRNRPLQLRIRNAQRIEARVVVDEMSHLEAAKLIDFAAG